MAEIGDGVVCLWRPKFVASVRSPIVVVPGVLGQHRLQVSFTGDQHAVGELTF